MGGLCIEIQECAASSSVHGLPKFTARSSRPIRFMWLVFFAAASVFMLIHFATLLSRFMNSPLATGFSVDRSSQKLPYIVLCTFGLSMSKIEALTIDARDLTSKKDPEEVMNALINLTTARNMRKVNLRTTLAQFLMHCKINDIGCTSSQHWDLVGDIGRHRCYQLNTSNLDLVFQNPTNLELYLYTEGVIDSSSFQQKKLAEIFEYDPTLYVLIKASSETCIDPFSGLKTLPGSQYDINLRQLKLVQMPLPSRKFDIAKCSNSHPLTVRNCNTHHEVLNSSPYICVEDTHLCLDNRIQEIVLHICNETSRHHDKNYIASCPATTDTLNSEHKSINDSQCVRNIVDDHKLVEKIAVLCTPCEKVEWKSSVLYSTWPREEMSWFLREANPMNLQRFQSALKQTLLDELGFLPNNSFKILELREDSEAPVAREIYQSHIAYVNIEIDLDLEVISEEMAYPLSSFLGEVGGIMGLWLGCSAVTFIEPIDLLLRVLERKLRQRGGAKKPENV